MTFCDATSETLEAMAARDRVPVVLELTDRGYPASPVYVTREVAFELFQSFSRIEGPVPPGAGVVEYEPICVGTNICTLRKMSRFKVSLVQWDWPLMEVADVQGTRGYTNAAVVLHITKPMDTPSELAEWIEASLSKRGIHISSNTRRQLVNQSESVCIPELAAGNQFAVENWGLSYRLTDKQWKSAMFEIQHWGEVSESAT